MRRTAAMAAIAVLGAVGANVPAFPASADDTTWAAVAFSASTSVMGFSWGYPIGSGPDSAVAQRALQECANHPLHPTDCRWLASARCVALAESKEYAQGGGGQTIEQAIAAANALPDNVDISQLSPPRTRHLCSEPGDPPSGLSEV